MSRILARPLQEVRSEAASSARVLPATHTSLWGAHHSSLETSAKAVLYRAEEAKPQRRDWPLKTTCWNARPTKLRLRLIWSLWQLPAPNKQPNKGTLILMTLKWERTDFTRRLTPAKSRAIWTLKYSAPVSWGKLPFKWTELYPELGQALKCAPPPAQALSPSERDFL